MLSCWQFPQGTGRKNSIMAPVDRLETKGVPNRNEAGKHRSGHDTVAERTPLAEKADTVGEGATPAAERPAQVATAAIGATRGTATIDYELIELFFFAYRDFTSDPDVILEKRGFGRAHHRVLHFVDREPGMTVADLLETLKITKQSLARVLKQLIDGGYIHQVAGPEDRRQRKLYTTREGKALARALAEPQSQRIADALAKAGPGGRDVIRRFLASMKTGQ
jgi:DNA-binding MarR family transcriptional regulator